MYSTLVCSKDLTWHPRSRYLPSRTVTEPSPIVYMPGNDPKEEMQINRKMLECAVGALNQLCPELEFLVFPSGTKVGLPLFKTR